MEDLITTKRDQLTGFFDRAVGTGQALNLSDAYFAYTNDVVRSFCFGHDNGLLSDLAEANAQRNNLATLLTSVKINKVRLLKIL